MALCPGNLVRFLESSRLPPMRIRSLLLLAPALLGVVVLACNGQGEGQPCDHNAGDSRGTGHAGSDDCQSPLICVNPPNPYTDGYRCCPVDLSQATTFECRAASGLGPDASPAPPEASTSDGPAESGPDAPPEAAPSIDASDGATPGDANEASSPADASEAASPADSGGG
jgi:hypothetical protein